MSNIQQLQDRIASLEKEVQSLQDVSIFADIRPTIEQDSQHKELRISTVNLHYIIRHSKKTIIRDLYARIARDLYKKEEDIQLLNPTTGTLIQEGEDLTQFVDEDGIIRLDFQYVKQACEHDHDHSHDLSDDEFSDDENFYNSCSCAHHS